MSCKLIALTGPSAFTPDCIRMLEDCLKANFVLLYQNRMEHVQQWLDACDGLVLSGGIDMHPTLYDENIQANMGLSKFDYGRDLKELLIIDYMMKQKKPILGICRGHQLLAVYKGLGSDFIMDLEGKLIHQPGKHNLQLQKNEPAHKIELLDTDLFNVDQPSERKVLCGLFPHQEIKPLCPQAWVNSWHHQGVKYLKRNKEKYAKINLKVLATAPSGMQDNAQIIEMMMGIGPEANWLSTQWHPEVDWDENTASRQAIEMFDALVLKYKANQKE